MPAIALFAVLVVLPPTDEKPPIALEDRTLLPFVDLLEPAAYSPDEFRALRSRIEHERDEKLEASRKTEKLWKTMLNASRAALDDLNKRSSFDTPAATARRAQLHLDVAALEQGIREKSREQDVTIPAEYDRQLAKLWLIERWPDRHAEILRRIDDGRARDRRHGNVEDIGYRKIVRNPEKDIEAGEQDARQMLAGGLLPMELQDDDVQRYVRSLAEKIALNSDLKVPLHVTVLDSPQPRVIALSGGFMFVNSGVLEAAQTESEFAGVLSREIARIAAQHTTRALKRSLVSRMFMPVAQIATGIFTGGINPGAYYGIGYGIQGLGGVMDHVLNDSSEGLQQEADQLGAQYAWKAGYDPRGFVALLDSLTEDAQADRAGKTPPLQERLLNLFTEIEYLPPLEHPIVDSPEFDQARRRVIVARGNAN